MVHIRTYRAAAYFSDDIGWLQFANGSNVLGYGTVIVSLTAKTQGTYNIS